MSIQVASGGIAATPSFGNAAAMTSDGTIHVVFRRNISGVWRPIWARSQDYGVSWTEDILPDVPASGAYSVALLADSSDNIWIAVSRNPAPGPVYLYRQNYLGGGTWQAVGTGTSWNPFTNGYDSKMVLDEPGDRIIIASYRASQVQRSIRLSNGYMGPVYSGLTVSRDWQYPQIAWDSGLNRLWHLGQTYSDGWANVNRASPTGTEQWTWETYKQYFTGPPGNYGVKAIPIGDRLVVARCYDYGVNDYIAVQVQDKANWNSPGDWPQYVLDVTSYGAVLKSRAWFRAVSDAIIQIYWYNVTTNSIWTVEFNLATGIYGTPEEASLEVTQDQVLFCGNSPDETLWLWIDYDTSHASSILYLEGGPEPGRPWWVGVAP